MSSGVLHVLPKYQKNKLRWDTFTQDNLYLVYLTEWHDILVTGGLLLN
jgi:hypothetical protein